METLGLCLPLQVHCCPYSPQCEQLFVPPRGRVEMLAVEAEPHWLAAVSSEQPEVPAKGAARALGWPSAPQSPSGTGGSRRRPWQSAGTVGEPGRGRHGRDLKPKEDRKPLRTSSLTTSQFLTADGTVAKAPVWTVK
jgi:hypothetical protein